MRAPRLLLVAGAAVLGLAIMIAAETVIRKETADAFGATQRHVETLARSLRDQIDAEFAATETLMRVAAAEAQREGLEAAAVRMSRMVAARRGREADFFMLDAAGNRIWASREAGLDPETVKAHLRAHARDLPQLHVTPLGRGPDPGPLTMHFSYPVTGGDGEVRGIVMAAINALQFQRSYGEMNLGHGDVLKLLGRDGVLLARVAGEAVDGGRDIAGSEWLQPQLRGCAAGVLRDTIDGISRIGSVCSMEAAPLLVGVGVDGAAAMAGVDANSRRYRIIAVLLVGLLAGGAMVMFVLLTRQQLTQAALRRSESRFRALNALGSDWYWETDAKYRLKHVSEGFHRMCGLPPESVSGKALWEVEGIMPVGSDWSGHQVGVARRAPFRDLALRFTSPQAVVAYGSLSGEPVFGEDGEFDGYRGIGNDITAEVTLRRRLRMQHDVTRILSQGQDGAATVREVIETVCRTMDWKWGARRHLDPGTRLLTCHEYWLAPGCSAGEFIALSMQPKPSEPRSGTVSQAILEGKIVWLTDHSPLNLRRSRLAREAGLRGAVSVPVRRSRGIEDALEFFSDRVEAPDQVTLDTLDSISSEVGQFLDRSEAQSASSHLQRELQHLLGRLELQLQHMPVACFLQDQNFRLVYCNPVAEKMFGYPLQELRGRDIAELIVPEQLRSGVWARRARVQAGDLAVSGTNENIRKDGTRIICDWSNTPLSDEAGGFAGVLATAQDVTERMKMVAALEESERRYRLIFESAPLPMWVAETATPRFLAVNDAMVAKYGYSREQLLQMSAVDLQVVEDRERVGRELFNRDPAATAFFERRHLTRDGRMLLVEITAQPFEFAGKPARLVVALDVTDRRMAQAALQESETRFRAIFEQASVGIAIRELTERPRFLRVNRKLCEILGYTESELLQKTTTDLTVEEDLDSTVQMNRQLMSGAVTSYSRRKRYRRRDGTPIWVNLSVSRLADSGGREKTGYLISVIEDISEQVASEARVLESEARYRQLFALTPLPMYLRDEDSLEFLEVNDACLALYGYSRDEMLAMTLVDIQTPENRERDPGALNRPAGIVEHLQKKHVGKGGRAFDVEIYSYPTTLSGRRVRLVLVRDMTDQMRMERLLRDNEARLRAIADNVPAVIAFFDDARQLQYSNIAFDRWFGTAQDGDPRYGAPLHPLLEKALRGDDVTDEITLDTLAGRRVVRMTLIPHRREDGAVVGVHLMGYDLTDFRHAEAEVHQLNAELEQRVEQRTRALAAANRELESFSYSVSHDLRAPLRTIDGFSQILLDEYAARLDETGRGYLERVRAGSQRMAKLIDDLLELARVTRRDLQIGDCDLSAMALDIARELALADPGRRVKVDVATGMVVAADSGLLRIALDNLLRNAWKFTGLRPDAAIEVGCTVDSAGKTYFVRDNGVGFDMTYANKLFGAFQRLHSDSEFQGTGIGLALVQRVIRRHGGNVWAEAQPGAGATFFFTLPAQSAPAAADVPPEPVRAGA